MYTVVVADDEEEIRRSLIRKVDWESTGFQVVGEAENGIEALELVEKLEPDLLLSDVKMPFVSGIELARQVREIRPTMQIAFLSGYDEFTYAQQAIQYNIISYMLKPISARELTEELKKIRQKMENKFAAFAAPSHTGDKIETSEFLFPLLLDEFGYREANDSVLLKEAMACGLIETKQPEYLRFVVVVTMFRDKNGKNATTRSSKYAIDSILDKYIKHSSVYTGGKVISLLMATEMGFEKYLHILVEEISQSAERILGLGSVVGISRVTDRLSSVHECYQEAMSATGYSNDEDSTVHYIADEEPMENLNHEIIQQISEDIENLVRNSSEQQLETYLDRLTDMVIKGKISQMSVNFMLLQIFSVLYKTVYAVAGAEAVEKLQEKAPLVGVSGLGAGSLQKYKEICLVARGLIAEQRRRSSEVLCEQAIHMIQEHFMEQELSLVSMSNVIAVSPNYLSAVLKKETGNTFKDLLTSTRIEEAKKLVLCSGMKIREVAEKCGYNDQHYFSYCFKKYTGMSPNGFRRAYEESEKDKKQG